MQAKQKSCHDRHTKVRLFSVGDCVFVLNFGSGNPWLGETVVEKLGSSLIVKLLDGQNVRRHVDHVRLSTCDVTSDVQYLVHLNHPSRPTQGEGLQTSFQRATLQKALAENLFRVLLLWRNVNHHLLQHHWKSGYSISLPVSEDLLIVWTCE